MTKWEANLVVRRASTGLGLFTLEAIPAGKRVIEYKGPIVTAEEVNRRRGRYFFEIDDNYAVDGSSRANVARYINHACRPNAEAFVVGKRIWIWSKRNIKAGEELTLDYGKAYFDDYIKPVGCKCAKCSAVKAGPRSSRKR
jgi:uncharacterized protein